MSQPDANHLSLGLLEYAQASIRSQSDHMAACFAELAKKVETLCTHLEMEPSERDPAFHRVAVLQSQEIGSLIADMVIDLQAHDITDQRLTHITQLIGNPGGLSELEHWMESALTERGERVVAEKLLKGESIQQAISAATGASDPDVELF